MMVQKSVRLYVNGTVQGVFFRKFIKENAEKLNLKGFVRNLEDGRVEIFIEGQYEDLVKMIALCKKGPKHSIIRDIEEKEEKFQDLKEFKVLHI